MKIQCPNCSFSKSVDKGSLPDKPKTNVVCPKCGQRFAIKLKTNKNFLSNSPLRKMTSKQITGTAIAVITSITILLLVFMNQWTQTTEEPIQKQVITPVEASKETVSVEVKEETKEEVHELTLQCAGDQKMIDSSPTQKSLKEDNWEAGPWLFTSTYKLTLDENAPKIELHNQESNEFMSLVGGSSERQSTYLFETTSSEFKYNMMLGEGDNYYTSSLTINRLDGAFKHTGAMTGGKLKNSLIQTGYCKESQTGATSF